jgi:tetratricopeptide (TPR) repeat protein
MKNRWLFGGLFLLMGILFPVIVTAASSDETRLVAQIQAATTNAKRFDYLLRLGKIFQQTSLQKADSINDQLLSLGKVTNNDNRVKAKIYTLQLTLLRGDRAKYFLQINRLQTELKQVKQVAIQVAILHLLAEYHISIRSYNQADAYLKEARLLANKLNNHALIADNLRLYSLFFMEKNDKSRALNEVDVAIDFARKTGDKSLLATCINTQSKIYYYFGQIEFSVSKNFGALQLAKEAGDLPKLANFQREIGEAQFGLMNYQDATNYFNQSKEAAEQFKDDHLVGLALSNLGMVSFAKKETNRAIAILQLAVQILQRFNDPDGLGRAHINLGNIYLFSADYNEALKLYNQALVYFESAGNRVQIAAVYHLIGNVFEKQGKFANALTYLKRSVAIRMQFGFLGSVYPTYRSMADVYYKTGNLYDAYRYLALYSNYSDSSKAVEVSTKIAEISELYRSEQRERLIEMQSDSINIQRKDSELTTAQLQNTRLRNIFQFYIIIGFVLLVFLGGIIVYSRWKQREIKQLQKEAEMNQVLLRSQMNPHFVFNAMSVIQSYIYENDTKNSSKFLVNFSKLMRLILENSSKEFIALTTEIDILNKYLETQQLRFGDRFHYSIDVPSFLLDNEAIIPPMITQPFIENAIEHGQLHTVENGFIHVSFAITDNLLQIIIEDNGVGRKLSEKNKKSKEHKSMAMKITQERINNLNAKFKTQGKLLITDFDAVEQTGTIVTIYIPYKTTADHALS